MRFRGKAAASWRRAFLSSLLWTTAAVAKPDTPTMKVTTFDHRPLSLRYFLGSDDVLVHDPIDKVIYRSDDAGANWAKVGDIPAGDAYILTMHEYDPNRAYILTPGTEHYRTADNGKSWTKFSTNVAPTEFQPDILRFHAGDPDRILFSGMKCMGILCEEITTYTTDGFKSDADVLRRDTSGCWWAKSSREFTTGDDDLDANRVLCIVKDAFSPLKEDQRLFVSDNYFQKQDGKVQEFEPGMDSSPGGGGGVSGIVNLATVKKFMLVATTSPRTDEMALYVSTNTKDWHKAMFPVSHGHTINQEAYTVLESTNYSIQVDVMNTRPSNPMGVLFTSNSDGTYFIENLEHTNRNDRGLVDFEKMSNIKGIFMVNKVENGDEVTKDPRTEKKVVTDITFDDGRTFEKVKADDDRIHLHSITEMINIGGRVFSSPAPGLVMGNGNTGERLKDMSEADLYVSDNAGVSWKKALDGPHKYDVGDQGSILVAVKESKDAKVSEFSYSLNHGDKWKQVSFPDDLRLKPLWLTTTQDSSTLKFLLLGQSGDDDKKYYMVSIDFDGLHERTCDENKDMEDWHARVDSDGKPTCLMGDKQTFRRRKKDSECFIREAFKEAVAKTEVCECSDKDFECDFNFVRNDEGECVPDGPLIDKDGKCKDAKPDDTFKGSSGWRLIPGNTCERTSGSQKDDPVERKCSETGGSRPPSDGDGEVGHGQFVFKSKLKDFEKYYLERSDSSGRDDETVIVRPYSRDGRMVELENKIWLTDDHGKKWKRILEDDNVELIMPHPKLNDVMFFSTDTKKVIYTVDRGRTFHSFEAPEMLSRESKAFSFHPDRKDWIIMLGRKCDEDKTCYDNAYLSRDRGDNWRTIARHARKCEFTGSEAYKFRSAKQIVCLTEEPGKGRRLAVSDDFFDEDVSYPEFKTSAPDGGDAGIRDFFLMSEFIIAGVQDKSAEGLLAFSSMDGKKFAQAKFPANVKAEHNAEYTILDSSTHAINMFLSTENAKGRRYGDILRSNSNGTSYVMSASGVNCDDDFYVDFEKIPGLEGVMVINTVANRDKVGDGGEAKRLQTKITHNDGSEWYYLPPPEKDMDGKAFSCRSARGDEKCALHLHGYTERMDKRNSYAAETAVGLMFGVGNVGPHLEGFDKADTYMTRDGGITWKQVAKGAWSWQYGDQGSLTVLVKQWRRDSQEKTNTVMYSADEGETWLEYKFSEDKVAVYDVTSQRSGSSRNFILWCGNGDGDIEAVNVDFSGLAGRPCEDADYYTWSPTNPSGEDECLFGHKVAYTRKKKDSVCYNDGRVRHEVEVKHCECTRRDFECAYNFELDNNGQCSLVPGLSPLPASEWCAAHPDEVEYFRPTGYRRIPLTTCRNGQEMDKALYSEPCKGHEEEYERRHRVSGVVIVFAVLVPFALAGCAGWWVWRNYRGQMGQIRLGEQRGFDADSPWVRYPVVAVSAVVALVAALPLVATALWRAGTSAYQRVGGGGGGGSRSWWRSGRGGGLGRFTTRDSFARGRGDYDVVDDVEGELLGEDSDEDLDV